MVADTHKSKTALTYRSVLFVDLTPPQLAVPTIYIITYKDYFYIL